MKKTSPGTKDIGNYFRMSDDLNKEYMRCFYSLLNRYGAYLRTKQVIARCHRRFQNLLNYIGCLNRKEFLTEFTDNKINYAIKDIFNENIEYESEIIPVKFLDSKEYSKEDIYKLGKRYAKEHRSWLKYFKTTDTCKKWKEEKQKIWLS